MPYKFKSKAAGGVVSLRQRTIPFLGVLRRSSEAGTAIVWGV
jgi:hypothetical protein